MIYLDNNATTRPNPNMLNAIQEEVTNFFGNPSSSHRAGRAAAESIEIARVAVANALGVNSPNIIFTSGGTESNNLAILGTGLPLITTVIEHSSVYNCNPLMAIPVQSNGNIRLDVLEQILKSLTGKCIVSVMLANNETGVISDPENKLLEFKEKYDFILHVDAVQGFGKILDYKVPKQVDMVSISGHKVHALKGIGALYVKDGIELSNWPVKGGFHENGMRPGTENHIGIASLGHMSKKINDDNFYRQRISDLEKKRNDFERRLSDICQVNGHAHRRICNTSNLHFYEIGDVELFVELLSEQGLCVSGGSACSSGMPEPSRVLTAMYGNTSSRPKGSIRISLSIETTDNELILAEKCIRKALIEYKEIKDVK